MLQRPLARLPAYFALISNSVLNSGQQPNHIAKLREQMESIYLIIIQAKNMSDSWIETLKYDDKGLIAAIAQDHQDGAILMMAWMNRQALELTIATREVHYWSRSRQELWHKGATSGHIQKLKQLFYDCDRDVILVKIEQIGNIACHTGARSCFFTEVVLP